MQQVILRRQQALAASRPPTLQNLPPPKITVFDGKLDIARSNAQSIAAALTTSAGLAHMMSQKEIDMLAKEILLCSEFETKKFSFIVERDDKSTGKSSMRGFALTATGGTDVCRVLFMKDLSLSLPRFQH